MVKGRTHRPVTYVCIAIVLVAAVFYFSLTCYRTLTPVDEGYLLYNLQKTAEGQIPHRDFYDDYGPAMYWVGGALFNLFGTKLIVIRIFLVVLKAAIALVIFLIGRKLFSIPFAVLASVLYVVALGDPYLPAINVLYAGYFSHFLALLGILFVFSYVERATRLWLFGAAICVGLSFLFKFHSAVFDLIGFLIFLCLKEQSRGFVVEDSSIPAEGDRAFSLGLMRGGKCIGLLTVIIFYLVLFARDHLDLYYFFLYLFPLYILLGHVFLADIKSIRFGKTESDIGKNLRNCYLEVIILLSGPILFLVLELIYYYQVNGLDEIIYDTFTLPMSMRFYKPMADYRLHACMIAAIVALVLAMVSIGRKMVERSQIEKMIFWWISFILILLPLAFLLFRKTSFPTWHMRMIYILPPTTLLLTSYLLIKNWREERLSGMNTNETLFLGLVFVFACQGFIMSFPRTDTTHVQVNSTSVFILISFLLWKLYLGWKTLLSRYPRVLGMTSVAACSLAVTIPFLWTMKMFYFPPATVAASMDRNMIPFTGRHIELGLPESYPMIEFDFPRSEGLKLPLWYHPPLHSFVMYDTYRIIRFIRENTASDDSIFVMCESQIIYFLAERENFVQKENYFVYLAVVELIDRADRVRLTDDQLLAKLSQKPPRFIVKVRGALGDHTHKIVAIWPKTADFIAKHYEVAEHFGVYEILQPGNISEISAD